MEEIWKDIPGYEGIYQASNLGRIRSINRSVLSKNGVLKVSKSRYSNTKPDSMGKIKVALLKNGKMKQTYIHNIVANLFLEKIEGKDRVYHKNGDCSDNRASNLYFSTFNDEIVSQNRALSAISLYKTGQYSYNELAEMLGVSNTTLIKVMRSHCSDLKNKKYYHNIGERSHWSKLSRRKVIWIRHLSDRYTQKELACRFKVCENNINPILKRKTWKHV